jgi:putative membrane protein
MEQTVESTSVAKPDPTQLALERTFLALERSMMAWIRTSTSLITFGLAYFKFFVTVHQHDQALQTHRFLSPRGFGLMMIGLGVFSLAIATIQHRQQLKLLRKQYPAAPRSLSWIIAGFISFVGICAFVEAILP